LPLKNHARQLECDARCRARAMTPASACGRDSRRGLHAQGWASGFVYYCTGSAGVEGYPHRAGRVDFSLDKDLPVFLDNRNVEGFVAGSKFRPRRRVCRAGKKRLTQGDVEPSSLENFSRAITCRGGERRLRGQLNPINVLPGVEFGRKVKRCVAHLLSGEIRLAIDIPRAGVVRTCT